MSPRPFSWERPVSRYSQMEEIELQDLGAPRDDAEEFTRISLNDGPGQEIQAERSGPDNLNGDDHDANIPLLRGWRLIILCLGMYLALFLANLEVTIVSTALVAISQDLGNLKDGSWIVTCYLIGYASSMLIWAKVSDLGSRRSCFAVCLLIFSVASLLCGFAQNLTQLIAFRGLQGVGGGGIVSLAFVLIGDFAPPSKYGKYAAIMTLVFMVTYLVGPLTGGIIVDHARSWKWIFWFNAPAGLVAMIMIVAAMPDSFPYMSPIFPQAVTRKTWLARLIETLLKIDWPGMILIFGGTSLLVYALQQGGISHPWSSRDIIIPLDVGLAAFGVLVLHEWLISIRRGYSTFRLFNSMEPILPWDLLTNRVFAGMMLATFAAGAPFTVAVISFPQRFQIVNGQSPTAAGVKFLAFTLSASVGSILSTTAATKFRIPPIYIAGVGVLFQIAAASTIFSVPKSTSIAPQIYVIQSLLSIGVSSVMSVFIVLMGNLVEGKSKSVALGALTQVRALGGVVGFAIATNILIQWVKNEDRNIAGKNPLLYQGGYDLQVKVMLAFAALQLLGLGIMWERQPRKVQ